MFDPFQFIPSFTSNNCENKCFSILYKALEMGESYYKRDVIKALGKLGNPECISLLIKELVDPGRRHGREEIAFILAKLGEQKGIEHLRKSLGSNECIFRRDARNFLSELYGLPVPIEPKEEDVLNPEDLKKEIEKLKDSDDPVDRLKVLRLMGKSGDQSYIPYSQNLLWDAIVSSDAAVTLYKLGNLTILPFLKKSLQGGNDFDSCTAFSALCKIGSLGFVPELKTALKDPDSLVRCERLSLVCHSKYDVQIKRYLLEDYLYDSELEIQVNAAIGFYFQEDPAFYHYDDLSLKNILMSCKFVPPSVSI